MSFTTSLSAHRHEISASSPMDRPAVARAKDPQKSRVANGSSLLPGVDGRSVWVRRCRELIGEHVSDLGGIDNVSAAERSIVRRACVLTVELERYEKRFALAGEASPEDLEIDARIAANLRRLLEFVGVQRRSKVIGPTLADILRERSP